jgi:hypothetical protein
MGQNEALAYTQCQKTIPGSVNDEDGFFTERILECEFKIFHSAKGGVDCILSGDRLAQQTRDSASLDLKFRNYFLKLPLITLKKVHTTWHTRR